MFEALKEALLNGKAPIVIQEVKNELAKGVSAAQIVDDGLCAGMGELGELFKQGKKFVPHLLLAAKAMKESMAVLRPQLVASGVKPVATAVIGTIKGDLHDIGKNLVGMMLAGAGSASPRKSSSRWRKRTGRRSSASPPCSPPRC